MLEFRDLRAAYSAEEVLHGIDAVFVPGSLTAIIGPNGCGKSTLLKCGAGLIRPSGGNVLLDGNDLASIQDRKRARTIAFMPQNRSIPELTVEQLAAHGRYPHLHWGQRLQPSDLRIISESLDRVRLRGFAPRPLHCLSGGERQRAYIAMMLSQQARLMLLDEPTAFLDLAAQFELMQLLRALCREGRSIGVALHDLSLALEYCDTILLMDKGQLVESGSPAKLCGSGQLERVFGVELRRTDDCKFLFYPCTEAQA